MERNLIWAAQFGNAAELIEALKEAVAEAGGDGSVIYVRSGEDGFDCDGTVDLIESKMTDGSAVYDIVLSGGAE